MVAQWSSLPRDIKLYIFDMLIHDLGENKTSTVPTKAGLSRYSVVDKEWQTFFEQKLYRHLSFSQYFLEDFDRIVSGWHRRSVVKHIEFQIQLKRYNCEECYLPTTSFQRFMDEYETAKGISQLFTILHQWHGADQTASLGGITLELEVFSPSDSQHGFKQRILDGGTCIDVIHWEARYTEITKSTRCLVRRNPIPQDHILCRLFEPSLPRFETKLPSVEVINSLLIRLKSRRTIGTVALQRIVDSLPHLESFRYEPWREWFLNREGTYNQDMCYPGLINMFLPKCLRSLSIFENFSQVYDDIARSGHWSGQIELVKTPCPLVGAALAQRSLELEQLSASYVIDARDFFQSCESDWLWMNLRSLALTSAILVYKSQKLQIHNFLVMAGKAAIKMPKLEVMELWYARTQYASVFQYRVTAGFAGLRWSGTLHMDIPPEVLNVWEKVALSHTGSTSLILQTRKIERCRITSHGAAIDELQLSQSVLHPMSLEKIQREAEVDFPGYRDGYAQMAILGNPRRLPAFFEFGKSEEEMD